MITLKFWNSLDNASRNRVASTFYFDDEHYAQLCKEEWHHSFDYNNIGKKFKLMLSNCYLRDNNYLEVRLAVPVTINKVKPKTSTSTPKSPTPTITKSSNIEPYYEKPVKFIITYDDGDDCSTVWCMAHSLSEATREISHEYWDFKRVIDWYIEK